MHEPDRGTVHIGGIALAGLDADTLRRSVAPVSQESHVFAGTLANVLRDRTGIVVAHRLTQAAQADLVLVVDHGRIVESGRRADLVEAGGGYAKLWAAWSAGRTGTY